MWYKLVIFIIASIGLTMIATRSELVKPLRVRITAARKRTERSIKYAVLWFLDEIFNCSLCFGVWGGMVVYIIIYRDFSWNIAIFGLISSMASYTFAEVVDYVKRN